GGQSPLKSDRLEVQRAAKIGDLIWRSDHQTAVSERRGADRKEGGEHDDQYVVEPERRQDAELELADRRFGDGMAGRGTESEALVPLNQLVARREDRGACALA